MEIGLGSIIALIGLSSPIVLFSALDKHLKGTIKERLVTSIYGSTEQTFSERIGVLASAIRRLIGKGIRGRVTRLFTISIISIIFIYSLQYLVNNSEYEEKTHSFVGYVLSGNKFAIASLLSFVVVDIISFWQTLVFFRLLQYCKNIFEVLFLSLSDVIMSLFIVVMLLPALLLASHILATSPHDTTFYLVLDSGLQPQDLSLRDALLLTAPKIDKVDIDSNEKFQDDLSEANQGGWYYTIADMSLSPNDKPILIEDVRTKVPFEAGKTIYFEKGDWPIEKTAAAISKIFKNDKSISGVTPVEAYSEILGGSIIILKISGRSNYSQISSIYDYTYIMNDVNFFGTDFQKTFLLSNKGVTENDMTWSGSLGHSLDNLNGRVYVTCDDNPDVSVMDRKDFIKNDGGCKNGVALTDFTLSGMSSFLSFNFYDNIEVPILPTALSSIFLTMFIYFVSLIWITLPLIRKVISSVSNDGEALFMENAFKISYIFAIIIFSPLIYAFS